MTPDERYTKLVSAFIKEKGVSHITEGKGFGSSGQLKVNGRIFAMLVGDELVLKLPREQVAALVAGREGTHFDAGKGKPIREWFVLSNASNKQWLPLAREAFDFVKG